MSKLGTPLNQTYEDAGFSEFLFRPFEGLGEASREWQAAIDEHAEDSNIHASAFTTTIAFSSSDYRTVTWAEGTITYKDGKVTPTVASGTTGNMSARTYIYYDPQQDVNALQTTTTAATATKGERLLLAIAVNNADTNKMAEVQTFGATGMYISNLTTEHLTSGSIRSKTVSLAIDPGQGDCYFNAGKTDYTNTDSGFILGLDDSDSDKAKFYIGDATTYLNWDGATLTIKGSVTITGGNALTTDGTTQALTGDFNLNDANVKIDGANKRIMINDGSNDRILVGYQSGGF